MGGAGRPRTACAGTCRSTSIAGVSARPMLGQAGCPRKQRLPGSQQRRPVLFVQRHDDGHATPMQRHGEVLRAVTAAAPRRRCTGPARRVLKISEEGGGAPHRAPQCVPSYQDAALEEGHVEEKPGSQRAAASPARGQTAGQQCPAHGTAAQGAQWPCPAGRWRSDPRDPQHPTRRPHGKEAVRRTSPERAPGGIPSEGAGNKQAPSTSTPQGAPKGSVICIAARSRPQGRPPRHAWQGDLHAQRRPQGRGVPWQRHPQLRRRTEYCLP